MDEESRQKFLKIYANLPLKLRDEIILVLEVAGKDQPVTWNAAYLEVKNNTETGKMILQKLSDLKII
jgi:hypothetical protein